MNDAHHCFSTTPPPPTPLLGKQKGSIIVQSYVQLPTLPDPYPPPPLSLPQSTPQMGALLSRHTRGIWTQMFYPASYPVPATLQMKH